MKLSFFLFALFFPKTVFANSFAPIAPFISGIGWIAMPVIVGVEAMFYRNRRIKYSFRLSLYSNIFSALVGLVFAVVTLPAMLGPAVDPYLWAIVFGVVISTMVIVFHWWMSSRLEFWFSNWHKLWKNEAIPLSMFYKANAITYGLIYIYFVIFFIFQFIDYFSQT